jgi:hypothetical protein
MKKLNLSSFVVGILFSASIFTIFAFTQNRETVQQQDQNSGTSAAVTPAQAAQYRANYEANFPQGLRGLNISKQQLEVLNQTATALGEGMRNISGFRLYYGSMTNDPNSQIVSLAYSINNTLQQNPPGQALQMAEGFSRSYAQQCPPFCD